MRSCKSESGFGLVEVLISLVILALVTVALVPLVNHGFEQVFRAGRKSQLLLQAESEMARALDNPDENDVQQVDELTIQFDAGEVRGTIIAISWDNSEEQETSITLFRRQEQE